MHSKVYLAANYLLTKHKAFRSKRCRLGESWTEITKLRHFSDKLLSAKLDAARRTYYRAQPPVVSAVDQEWVSTHSFSYEDWCWT